MINRKNECKMLNFEWGFYRRYDFAAKRALAYLAKNQVALKTSKLTTVTKL